MCSRGTHICLPGTQTRVQVEHTCAYTWNTHMCTRDHTREHSHIYIYMQEHKPVCSSDNNRVFSWNAYTCPIGTHMCAHVNTHINIYIYIYTHLCARNTHKCSSENKHVFT